LRENNFRADFKGIIGFITSNFIVNHFTFISSSSNEEHLHLYFEEKNDTTLFKDRKVESKGFHKEIVIEDFPLRGKLVYFHIKRRRWRDIETRETLQRDWKSIGKGTRMTEDFAAFLKEINRY